MKLGVMPGETWTEQATDRTRRWQAVASSADGSRLVAGQWDGDVYTSLDGGVTWRNHNRGLGGSAHWVSVASSADGRKLVAASSTEIHTSEDGGDHWQRVEGFQAMENRRWTSLASSSDGETLVASSISETVNGQLRPGEILISTNGGGSWTALQDQN